MSALHRFTFTSLSSTSGAFRSAAALGLGLALSLHSGGCQQPQSYCTTAHGDYAASYKLKSGDPQSACGQLTGDIVGLQTYFATGGLNGTPRFSEASMAIRPAYLGNLIDRGVYNDPSIVDPDSAHTPNAIADFTTAVPDGEEFCEAPKFSAAELALAELPLIPGDEDIPDDPEDPDNIGIDESTMDTPIQPATSIRYEWSNARVLVSANYQGTQFSANLKFTQDGCTAEYEVVAVYPLAYCNTDDDCQDTSVTGINPDFDLKCQPRPDPIRWVNPDKAPKDYQSGFCVLNGDIPALK